MSALSHLDSAVSGFRGTLEKHPRDVARVELICLTRALVIARIVSKTP